MKQEGIEAIHTVGYLAFSLGDEQNISVMKQYWSKGAIRFDVGDTTSILRSNGRLLYIDHAKRHVTRRRAANFGGSPTPFVLAGTNADATFTALRKWLEERGVQVSGSPRRSHTIYLGIPCSVITYYDKHEMPILTIYQPRQGGGPGVLKVVLLVLKENMHAIFVWDTVLHAKVKVSPSVFDIPTGYTVTEEK
ncbi:MAG: hypothetical protein ACP5RN_15525 [Armatimonadota bacterium]